MKKEKQKQNNALIFLEGLRNIKELQEALEEEINRASREEQRTGKEQEEAGATIGAYKNKLIQYNMELTARKSKALEIIKQMKTDNQFFILCRYFQNQTITEISENTGYTYKWAWVLLDAAKKEFAEIYEKEPDTLEEIPAKIGQP